MLLTSMSASAQIQKMQVGVNGLTCSQCSRSVYKKLSQLEFIQSVEMDLNAHTSTIILKDPNNYDVDRIAQAVIDAGYSVRSMKLFFDKKGLEFKDGHFVSAHQKFYFTEKDPQNIKAHFEAVVIGKKYNSEKKMNKLIPDGFINQLSKTYFVVIN